MNPLKSTVISDGIAESAILDGALRAKESKTIIEDENRNALPLKKIVTVFNFHTENSQTKPEQTKAQGLGKPD